MPRTLCRIALFGVFMAFSMPLLQVCAQKASKNGWNADFPVKRSQLSSTGKNPYFILDPGNQLVLEDGKVRLIITVLDKTRVVDGVETRVVEEHESKAGKPMEISRNYFAIDKETNDLYYFGEQVNMYNNGRIVSHEGAWLSGENGAKFGMLMPGRIKLKAKYYQEMAPKVAMDRAEIVGIDETVKTPAGEFKNCVKTEETSLLEPGVKEYKYYAPGLGIIQDGPLKLVSHGTMNLIAKPVPGSVQRKPK